MNNKFFLKQVLLKKNRNGFLLAEETLKIILAVISIGFLVYFLSALYFANQNSKDLEQAKASLKHLVDGINSGAKEVQIYNPEGWAIISWSSGNEIPNSCNEKSCICICDNPLIATKSNFLDNCNDKNKGFCLENTKKLVVSQGNVQTPILIKDPPINLQINKKTISRK
ncbi:MAG TPA: hypothetical protein ENI61_00395 [Ignavibacteria bacterium]|nr:hypothetical protein [Ignavibacteria bacterium]